MNGVKTYLLTLIAAAFLVALIKALFQTKETKMIISLVCGIVLILVSLSPVSKLEPPDLAQIFSRFYLAQKPDFSGIIENDNVLTGQIIKERSQTYILDKAAELHFTPSQVNVSINTTDKISYPEYVEIAGKYTQRQRIELSLWIEQNMAIPQTRQTWTWK